MKYLLKLLYNGIRGADISYHHKCSWIQSCCGVCKSANDSINCVSDITFTPDVLYSGETVHPVVAVMRTDCKGASVLRRNLPLLRQLRGSISQMQGMPGAGQIQNSRLWMLLHQTYVYWRLRRLYRAVLTFLELTCNMKWVAKNIDFEDDMRQVIDWAAGGS